MANTTVSKITISKDNADALVNSIRDGLKTINKGYLAIAPDVQKLYDTHAFEVLGYKNFDAMCTDLFEMSHGTTVGIRKVFAIYGSKSKDGKYSIPEKYQEWGYTKLLLFATDKDKFKDANIDPLTAFDPSMTIGEMKMTLATALADKAKEQDTNAIETTAEETTAEETSAEETTAEETTAEETTAEPMTMADWATNPRAYCEQIINDMTALKGLLENDIKPEKLAILDGAIAYMKEVKKSIKK